MSSPADAVAAASAVAGDSDVDVFSADIGEQLLNAGLIDELYLHISLDLTAANTCGARTTGSLLWVQDRETKRTGVGGGMIDGVGDIGQGEFAEVEFVELDESGANCDHPGWCCCGVHRLAMDGDVVAHGATPVTLTVCLRWVVLWVCGMSKLLQYGGVIGRGGWSVRCAVGALAAAGALDGEDDVLVVGV